MHPQLISLNKCEEEVPHFYAQLNEVVDTVEKNSIAVLIGGDFNAKLDIRNRNGDETGDIFMGDFGKDKRNVNGDCLSNFLKEHNYYVSNTKFHHPLRHRTTWIINNNLVTKTNGITKLVRNQIDYILVKGCLKNSIEAARAYHGHIFSSDHGIVITAISMGTIFKLRCKYNNNRR